MRPDPNAKPSTERLLLVDDVPANLEVLSAVLEPHGFEILAAPDGVSALRVAARARPDLILLDVLMPELDGIETCRRLKADPATREIPVIFLTARAELQGMVEGFRAGGVDYVVKPFQPDEVVARVATHLGLARLTRELQEKNRVLEARTRELTEEADRRRRAETALKQADDTLAALSDLEASRWNLTGFVGESPSVRRILNDVRRLHQFAHTSVLITGESGTGKELIARALHFGSPRSKAPFVPVNCVAIPADLAESTLFGHVKGAFTGATSDRKGCFELAHGGTLFLDEMGDMPAALQVKLLRVLEDGWVTAVGSSEPRRVDVRVVAATNADLEARMAAGSFRQDLYFRLARFTVRMPPLRERLEDLPALAAHFMGMFSSEMGLREPRLTSEAVLALGSYAYPGNVRELRNLLERALIESGGEPIEPRHLHFLRRPATSPAATGDNGASPGAVARAELAASLPLNLAEAEDVLIQRAMQVAGGNISDAARLLGVHRTRIYRKLAQEEASSPGAGVEP
jgi:DNA-binding NtrC family response regulator